MSGVPALFSAHLWRTREGSRPLHLAGCWCWTTPPPSSFAAHPEPRSSLWAYLSSPFRTRGQGWP